MAPRASHLRSVADVPDAPAPGREPVSHARVVDAIGGDMSAWAELYAHCYPSLFRQLRYLTGDDALAEELAQETFARAIASTDRYDHRRPFAAWVYGIALNVARRHWRSHRSTSKAHARLAVVAQTADARGDSSPLEGQVQRQRSRMLYDLLDTLPDRWREAFVLREIEGLSVEETATRLAVTPKNVSVRTARARTRIREEIVRRGWGDDTGVQS